MNLVSKRLATLLWSSLIVLAMPAPAAVVTANFASATTVPVTAAGYTGTGNTVNFTLSYRRSGARPCNREAGMTCRTLERMAGTFSACQRVNRGCSCG